MVLTPRSPRLAIIGAGMSGICMSAKLKAAGFHDFVIFEKAEALGGTWRENTYPGVACDVPSYFYQFTFDRNPEWSHLMSPGSEINTYLEDVARRHGVIEHITFGTELTRAEHTSDGWVLTSRHGEEGTFDFLISATGILHHPKYPEIQGLESFAGECFHSARWNHDVELADKRVGIIGTGSTGAQIIAALGGQVRQLDVFQRTPQWVLPLPNPAVTGFPRTLASHLPGAGLATRAAMKVLLSLFIEGVTHAGWERTVVTTWVRSSLRSIKDPELRAKLTPDFEPLCRRLVISSGYYQALQRPGVSVVTDAITGVEPEGVRTADGALHELDVLVLATGFDAQAFVRPMELVGRDGVTLSQAWANGPRGYRTVAQPGFPNYFTLMGPHSPVGNFSLTTIAETQADYVLKLLGRWASGEIDSIDPQPEITADYNAELREAAQGTIWATGCKSWYLGPDGVPELWPWHPRKHQEMLASVDWDEFQPSAPALAPKIS